MENVSKFYLS